MISSYWFPYIDNYGFLNWSPDWWRIIISGRHRRAKRKSARPFYPAQSKVLNRVKRRWYASATGL